MANVVKFAIPERKIDNTGITFSRSHNGYKHGDIRIRQNFIDWPALNRLMADASQRRFDAVVDGSWTGSVGLCDIWSTLWRNSRPSE